MMVLNNLCSICMALGSLFPRMTFFQPINQLSVEEISLLWLDYQSLTSILLVDTLPYWLSQRKSLCWEGPVTKNWGWPLANGQRGNEALSPAAWKELSNPTKVSWERLLSQLTHQMRPQTWLTHCLPPLKWGTQLSHARIWPTETVRQWSVLF